MFAYRRLTTDYEDYLLRLYFGPDITVRTCIVKAYLDFNRTLHGIGRLPERDRLYTEAVSSLEVSFAELKKQLANPFTGDLFDNWHKLSCQRLTSIFPAGLFHYGQAQKWVNMTLKYIYTLGEENLTGFEPAYAHCHIPIDNIVVEQLAKRGFPPLTVAWSRMDYDDYFRRQQWIRERFAPAVPMDVEFYLWMGRDLAKVEASGKG